MLPLRSLFAGTIFLGAFLLFLVEPIAARQLLPVLGGSAAVWITCLVFFQTALLLGYLYAHWLSRQPLTVLHLFLLAIAAASAVLWVVHTFTANNGDVDPVRTVFAVLGSSIGLPFLALAATSPLLQVWWSRVESGPIPYRLYALSNLASLLALAAYPTIVEPYLTLHAQRLAWCCGFVLFAILCGLLAIRMPSRSTPLPQAATEDPGIPRTPLTHKLLWLLLPMGAAMQLSAVTSFLTANVAAIPLLWILPLSVYLITIIIAFQFARRIQPVLLGRFLIVFLASLGYALSHVDVSWPLWVSIIIFLLEIFLAGLFLHCEAVALRPARASESTVFYLLFAAGGALGSFFIGIACPYLFTFNYDLPITVFITALLALAVTWNSGWSQRMLWSIASAMLLALLVMVHIASQRETTVAVRNFYAALRVKQNLRYPATVSRTLMNGIIEHGSQLFGTDELRHTPTTYYTRDSGVGLVLRFCCPGPDPHTPRPRRIGVIGLGAGTIAAYGRPGDRITFYDINPAVAPIARNVFTYIRDSGAKIDVVVGDARKSLAREEPQHFDVLVVDAFSGDAIPIHLLTREALALYRRHLAPGGILAFHISNRHVDLEPPIAVLAASAGMEARHVHSLGKDSPGGYPATWMLVTDNAAFFLQPELVAHAFYPDTRLGIPLWTDDYSALLPVLTW
jgi:SAM-dependent methyltransferase